MTCHLDNQSNIVIAGEVDTGDDIIRRRGLDGIDWGVADGACGGIPTWDVTRLGVGICVADGVVGLEGGICPICLDICTCRRILLWPWIARRSDWSCLDKFATDC